MVKATVKALTVDTLGATDTRSDRLTCLKLHRTHRDCGLCRSFASSLLNCFFFFFFFFFNTGVFFTFSALFFWTSLCKPLRSGFSFSELKALSLFHPSCSLSVARACPRTYVALSSVFRGWPLHRRRRTLSHPFTDGISSCRETHTESWGKDEESITSSEDTMSAGSRNVIKLTSQRATEDGYCQIKRAHPLTTGRCRSSYWFIWDQWKLRVLLRTTSRLARAGRKRDRSRRPIGISFPLRGHLHSLSE